MSDLQKLTLRQLDTEVTALRADVDALATEVARLSALVEGYMGLYRKLEAIVERYLAPQAELLAPHPREDSARCVSDACFVCGEPIGESQCAVRIVSTLSRKQRLHWPECAAMYIKQQVSGDVAAARLDELRTLRNGDLVWCREVDGSESPRVVDGEPRCMPSGLWAVPLDGDDGLVTLLRRLRRRDSARCEP